MTHNYILDGDNNPVPAKDILEWHKWYETADRKVASTDVSGANVSTVFLATDHGMEQEKPVLWETMVFFKPDINEEWCERYTSHEDAERGHRAMVYLAAIRNTAMGRAILLGDWSEAWRLALLHVELEDEEITKV